MRRRLTDYLASDGALMVSGSFLGTDLETPEECDFARQVLRYLPAGTARQDSTDYVRGLNIALPIQRAAGGERYAVQAPDAIVPADSSAFTAFAYGGGQSAGIASSRRGARVIAMGFPFESITDAMCANRPCRPYSLSSLHRQRPTNSFVFYFFLSKSHHFLKKSYF